MRPRVRSRLGTSTYSKEERSRMATDFVRLGYLVTDHPLTADVIADLVHALEDGSADQESTAQLSSDPPLEEPT